MKKLIALLFITLNFICVMTSCAKPEDKILNSLGKYDNVEYYSEGEFQDYTDYAKYYFPSSNIADNKYFNKIKNTDINVINDHLDDFEIWIKEFKNNASTSPIVVNYDFDRSLIDEEDYICINSEKHKFEDGSESLINYDIYFFDTQTNILYYFHNNI